MGMGRALAQAHPEARQTFEDADRILGIPLSRLMWEGPEEELVLTRNAQPAILVHSVAVLRVVRDRIAEPVVAAGHSLGEFSAWVAADALSFEDALGAVRLRGELMHEAGRTRPGTMAAVLGLDDARVLDVCREASHGKDSVVVPANLNSHGQVVISGDTGAVERATELARTAGAKKVVGLNVSGAFHSPLMRPAEEGLRERLDTVIFGRSVFPVVSNVTARPVVDPGEAKRLLVEQLTSPVQWAACVGAMIDAGADRFLELGPGRVLTGLNRRNAGGAPTRALGEPDDIESLGEEWQGA